MIRVVVPDARHSGAVTRRLLRVADAVAGYRGHRGTLAVVMAWSIVVQVLRITQAWLLALGLGIVAPFAYYLLVMPLGLLMLLLPVSVSGFGVPQGVIVWLLRPIGVADEVGTVVAPRVAIGARIPVRHLERQAAGDERVGVRLPAADDGVHPG